MIDVFLECISGIPNKKITVDSNCSGEFVYETFMSQLPEKLRSRTNITLLDGSSIRGYTNLEAIAGDSNYLNLQVRVCLCGGKGGYGQQLKAEAKKISKTSVSTQAKDNMRLLNGERVGDSVRNTENAKKLKEKQERCKQEKEAKRAKLQALVDKGLQSTRFEDAEYLENKQDLVIKIHKAASAKSTDKGKEKLTASPKTSNKSFSSFFDSDSD